MILFMASKHSTRKNTSGQNQPASRDVKDSISGKLLNSLLLILLDDILHIFLPNPPLILHIPLHSKLLIQINIILWTKSFTVLHRKILCIEFWITKLTSSANTPMHIFNLSVIFSSYTKFQYLVLLIEELNHSVRMRL